MKNDRGTIKKEKYFREIFLSFFDRTFFYFLDIFKNKTSPV